MNKAQIKQDATCSTCCHYLAQDHDMGACHRYPPSFAGENTPRELHKWRFPLVTMRSWCGEHKPAGSGMPATPRDGQ
ncbi:MAG: hypothetical protein A2045_06185 [Rhodocyclales bacterium GWA2_65_20]|nr:MAG: hypothetical protein A2045_06185 [Rhodocyclales bacterium GWA2_65_20]